MAMYSNGPDGEKVFNSELCFPQFDACLGVFGTHPYGSVGVNRYARPVKPLSQRIEQTHVPPGWPDEAG